MKRIKADCENFQRRDFLHVGALSLMGLGLPSLMASEAAALELSNDRPADVDSKRGKQRTAKAKNIIMVWLSGGPSTIDMWDLKPHAPKSIRGEFSPIDTSASGIQISEHLSKTAKQMKLCSLVRSVSHTVAEHGQGTEYVMTGNPINPALRYPSIGSVVSARTANEGVASNRAAPKGVPNYMDLSGLNYGKAGYLGTANDPFIVDNFRAASTRNSKSQFDLPDGFTVGDLTRRSDLLKKLETGFRRFDETPRATEMKRFQQQAVDILRTGKTREALNISRENRQVRDRYGRQSFGQSALAARRLIQAGVRFVTIGFAGWDTHANNFGLLRGNLLPQLDTGLSALVSDLEDHGLLDETIVYCAGEFNRTPSINGQGGRDHWARSMSVLLAGGGLKKGFAYGSTDKHGMEPDADACSPSDINATILRQIGIEPDSILKTQSGRPVQVFKNGHAIEDLVA